MSSLSNRGVQFCPPSIVFQTPPATPPKYHVSGSPGTPSIASARPPRKGPICRHCIPLNNFSSTVPGGTAVGDGLAASVGVGEPTPGPPPRGGGLTANACEQTKVKAAKINSGAAGKRKVHIIIRLR